MESFIFDCNVMLGGQMGHQSSQFASAEELLAAMDDKGINKAVVYHSLAKHNNPKVGNAQLMKEIALHDRLVPCWSVLPHYTSESLEPDQLLEEMRLQGVKSVRAFPTLYNVEMHVWLWKELLDSLSVQRVPLFLDFNSSNWSVSWNWDQIYRLLEAFPKLPVVLVRVGALANRYLYFLLDKFPNLYLEISYYQNNNGLVDIAEKFGAGRMLYGSAMPVYDPRFGFSAVHLSGLNTIDKENILGGNLEKLLLGVEL